MDSLSLEEYQLNCSVLSITNFNNESDRILKSTTINDSVIAKYSLDH